MAARTLMLLDLLQLPEEVEHLTSLLLTDQPVRLGAADVASGVLLSSMAPNMNTPNSPRVTQFHIQIS